jgi:hypothetical protein
LNATPGHGETGSRRLQVLLDSALELLEHLFVPVLVAGRLLVLDPHPGVLDRRTVLVENQGAEVHEAGCAGGSGVGDRLWRGRGRGRGQRVEGGARARVVGIVLRHPAVDRHRLLESPGTHQRVAELEVGIDQARALARAERQLDPLLIVPDRRGFESGEFAGHVARVIPVSRSSYRASARSSSSIPCSCSPAP